MKKKGMYEWENFLESVEEKKGICYTLCGYFVIVIIDI